MEAICTNSARLYSHCIAIAARQQEGARHPNFTVQRGIQPAADGTMGNGRRDHPQPQNWRTAGTRGRCMQGTHQLHGDVVVRLWVPGAARLACEGGQDVLPVLTDAGVPLVDLKDEEAMQCHGPDEHSER